MPRSFSSKLLPTDRALYNCVGDTSLFIVVLIIEDMFDFMYPPALFRCIGVSLCFALFLFMSGLMFWHDFIFRTFICNDILPFSECVVCAALCCSVLVPSQLFGVICVFSRFPSCGTLIFGSFNPSIIVCCLLCPHFSPKLKWFGVCVL